MKEFQRIELCNLDNPRELDICLEMVGKSLKNSVYTLTAGGNSDQFLDIDGYLSDQEAAGKFIDLLTQYITTLQDELISFDKIAVIDKGGKGPVGLISHVGSFAQSMPDIDFVIVRPEKHLIRSAIKGLIKRGDRVLLLNDVATSGGTIYDAAEKLHAAGATIPGALVAIDRYQGAIANLARKGIQLVSFLSLKRLVDEKKSQEIKKLFKKEIEPAFKPRYLDLGGASLSTMS